MGFLNLLISTVLMSLAASPQNAAESLKETPTQNVAAIATGDSTVSNLLGGSFDLEPTVIAGGAGTSSSGSFALDGTIGQAAVDTLSGSTFTIAGGFWNQVSGSSAAPKKRRGQITSQ